MGIRRLVGSSAGAVTRTTSLNVSGVSLFVPVHGELPIKQPWAARRTHPHLPRQAGKSLANSIRTSFREGQDFTLLIDDSLGVAGIFG